MKITVYSLEMNEKMNFYYELLLLYVEIIHLGLDLE